MSGERKRFTAWLSPTERQAVRDKANQWGASENYVVRMAIRTYLALPTEQPIALGVTVVTGNNGILDGEDAA